MRIFTLLACTLLFGTGYAQIITTIAGNGIIANTGDGGAAISASINYPTYLVFDKYDNLYITTGVNGKTVRKINGSGIITTIAGTGSGGNSGDGGAATLAKFNNPQGVAVDTAGNIYVADAGSNVIRKVTVATGIISTIAGVGTAGYGGDSGMASAAALNGPNGICIDKFGNIYIADYGNNRVRKINPAGIITTYVGTGIAGYNGDGGISDTSQIRGVFDICVDNLGNLYVADEANNRIRKVDLFGKIYTIAGNGTSGYGGDGEIATNAKVTPHDISCDKFGNLYSCDLYENKIRVITTNGIIKLFAGTGTMDFSGDGGSPLLATFKRAYKVSFDSCNNAYFSDLNNYRVRKVTYSKCNYLEVDKQFIPDISVYPNPANEELHVEGAQPHTTYQLYNIVGAVVQGGYITKGSSTIAIKHLPPGLYLLALTDEDGKRTVHKIVKE